MLIKRIVTALALLAILLPALFYAPAALFDALVAVLLAAGMWEWAGLNGVHDWRAVVVALLALVNMVWLWSQGHTAQMEVSTGWLVITAVWLVAGGLLLAGGIPRWQGLAVGLRMWTGFALLVLTWLAICQLRARGINLLLSSAVLVWVADIAAYFAGRMFGGKLFGARRLAPSLSPGKTWEGVLGGFIGVVLLAMLWLWLDVQLPIDSSSLYTRAWQRMGLAGVLPLALLTAMAVMGDLFESLVKRFAGVKDASNLLPGHGGVLDRVDALLPTMPAAMMLVTLLGVP